MLTPKEPSVGSGHYGRHHSNTKGWTALPAVRRKSLNRAGSLAVTSADAQDEARVCQVESCSTWIETVLTMRNTEAPLVLYKGQARLLA